MSLVRPRVRALLGQGLEPMAYGIAALLGGLLALRGFGYGAWITVLLGLAIVGVAGTAALAWYRRSLFGAMAGAAGVVEVDERRVGYWGPEAGGFVDLDLLTRLEIDTGSADGPVWILRHEEGPPLRIPLDAQGADRLADLFAALPGVRLETAAAARHTTANARFLIWKREAASTG